MALVISRVEMSKTYVQKNKCGAPAERPEQPWKLRNIKEKPIVSKTGVSYHVLFYAWGLRLHSFGVNSENQTFIISLGKFCATNRIL